MVAGVGLYWFSGDEAETTNSTSPPPVTAAIPTPSTLVMITKADKADAYAKRIQGVQDSVNNFDVHNHTVAIKDLNEALNTFDSWASFIGEGIDMNLSADASAQLEALYESAQTMQQNALPILRDQYGPLIRTEFAKVKTAKTAMTVGKGYKQLVFTSADFKDKDAVEQFHADSLELFINLRFEQITYRDRKWDEKPSNKEVSSFADNVIIDWTSDKLAGALGVEHVFTAANHNKVPATETAEAETEQ